MSSPGIKLQSLIRKFKNLTKEQTDKQKIIKNYQYDFSNNDALDVEYLFQANNPLELYTYNLCPVENIIYKASSAPINIYNFSVCDNILWTDLEDEEIEPPNIIHLYVDTQSNSTTTKGYLNNIFNAELCNEIWLINLYIMHNIHANFITNDNVKVKSLHIGDISILSAYNHYIYNGKLPELVNPEWLWLSTANSLNYKDTLNVLDINKKYPNNLLQLLETDISSYNNINYIINEVNNKLFKINFLAVNYNTYVNSVGDNYNNSSINQIIDISNKCDYRTHVTYVAFVIKIMDINGIVFIRIPEIIMWNTEFINILLLYSLIFNEVYIFKFNLVTNSTYLLCKNKKKISNETIYKKLISIISNTDFTSEYNLFSKEIFTIPSVKIWLEHILDVKKNNTENGIEFKTILDVINKTLNNNVHTFL